MLLCSCHPQPKTNAWEQAMHEVDSLVSARGPIMRLAVTSAPQVGFLAELDALDRIVGASTPDRYYHPLPETVVNIGEDFQLDVERILLLKPDVLLLTDYGFEITGVRRIEAAGIPTLYLSEWKESDPIARAEWIRVIAGLVRKDAKADSILTEVKHQYNSIASLAPQGERVPQSGGKGAETSVCTGQSYRGTWYVPTGKTYMGRLLADAGANYSLAHRTEAESIPLTVEEAILQFKDAEIWIGVNVRSMDELRNLDEKHTWIRAFQTGQVYHWMRRTTTHGGNDFWETGVVHPEYILSDIMWALHPEARESSYKPHFIQQCLPPATTEP